MMRKVAYQGYRTEEGCYVTVLDAGPRPFHLLNPRLDLVNHSPTGFEWGYMGSGPAQLALAILADFYDDATALHYYQAFKTDVIAPLSCDTKSWLIDERIIARWMESQPPTDSKIQASSGKRGGRAS